MSADQQRAYLLTLYGDKWKARVRSMSDAQVIAVYNRIQSKEAKRKSQKEDPR